MRSQFRTLLRFSLMVGVAALALGGCKKEEAKPAEPKAAEAAKEAPKEEAKEAPKEAAKEAPKEEPKAEAPALVLAEAKDKEIRAKIESGKPEDLMSVARETFDYFNAAKAKADNSGFEDGQLAPKLADALVNKMKTAAAAGADAAAKQKLVDDFASVVGPNLSGAKSKVHLDWLSNTPACAIAAGSPAAADAAAGAFATVAKDVHGGLLSCLFQSGPQTATSYFGIADDAKAKTARLGKALAATADAAVVKDLLGRLPMFSPAAGVDEFGDAAVAKFNPADKELLQALGQALKTACNVKQLGDYAAKVGALPDPLKGELKPIADDLVKTAGESCKK